MSNLNFFRQDGFIMLFSDYSQKYKTLSSLYINDTLFTDSYSYGLKRQHNFLSSQALINNQIGEMLMLQTKYSGAIDILLKNEKLCLKTNDKKSLALTYNLLGIMNHRLHRFNRALQFFDLCITFAERSKDYRMLSSVYENISNVYSDKKEINNAIQVLIKSIFFRNSLKFSSKFSKFSYF